MQPLGWCGPPSLAPPVKMSLTSLIYIVCWKCLVTISYWGMAEMDGLQPYLKSNVHRQEHERVSWLKTNCKRIKFDILEIQCQVSKEHTSRSIICNCMCRWGAQNRPRIIMGICQVSEYYCCRRHRWNATGTTYREYTH